MEQTILNDQLIGYHRNLYDYVQSPENSLQLAFGDLQYRKFTNQLISSSNILKIKVLQQLNDCFKLSNNIDLALLSSDILDVLLTHFSNEDNTIRQLSSRAVSQVAKIYLGKNQLLACNGFNHISKLLNDNVEKIRENGYNCLLYYSDTQEGKDRILETSILPQLIQKLRQQKVIYLLIRNLEILNSLFEGEKAITQTLSTTAIVDLLDLLSNQSDIVKELVINNLASISFNELGKSSIIFKNGVIRISPFVNSPSVAVVEATTICLCSLAQINEAKDQIINQGKEYFKQLIDLLDHKNKQIVTNTIQLIGSIAEHKEGRQWSLAVLPKIKSLKGIDEDYLKQTIDIIEWKP